MAQKVVVPAMIAQAGKDYLTERGYQVVAAEDMSTAALAKLAPDAAGIMMLVDPFDDARLKDFPNLKILARHGAGYDNLDAADLGKHGIWVTNTPTANSETVAETTLAMLLDLSKNITRADRDLRAGVQNHFAPSIRGIDVAGKTLGILGYGHIGQALAKKVQSLGMQVLFYSRHAQDDQYGHLAKPEEILQQADFVSLHLPVTPETKDYLQLPQFKLMKSSAYLLNLGRGQLVNEADLVTALQTHEIAGAALDVTTVEPLPADSPLRDFGNVILTPHIGSNTAEAMERMAVGAATQIDQVLQGKQPTWAVNQLS